MAKKENLAMGIGIVADGKLVAGCQQIHELTGWDTLDDLSRDVVRALAAFIAWHAEGKIVQEVAIHFHGIPTALAEAIQRYLPASREAAKELAESFIVYQLGVCKTKVKGGRNRGKE